MKKLQILKLTMVIAATVAVVATTYFKIGPGV